jgi:ribonuclease HII
MILSIDNNKIEVGIDEAGRGCMSGRVYAAAVILPKEFKNDDYLNIKDSKKISRKKRKIVRKYIEENAIDYGIGYCEPEEIDRINILNASIKSMHRALNNLSTKIDYIYVDGNKFSPYYDDNGEEILHSCILQGDNKYYNIAAASILAKENHDDYVKELVKNNPDLEKYGWLNNMCYGAKTHIDAIKEYGITSYHRKTFGICKNYM